MKRSQSMTEIVLMIACVAIVLLVMQAYMRRGISGHIKTLAESTLGTQFDPTRGKFNATSVQSGAIAYKTNVVWDPSVSEEFDENATYPVAYQVLGPNNYVDNGTEEIPADTNREPMTVTSVTTSEVDNLPLGSAGGIQSKWGTCSCTEPNGPGSTFTFGDVIVSGGCSNCKDLCSSGGFTTSSCKDGATIKASGTYCKCKNSAYGYISVPQCGAGWCGVYCSDFGSTEESCGALPGQ
jgi:hypothetical protein